MKRIIARHFAALWTCSWLVAAAMSFVSEQAAAQSSQVGVVPSFLGSAGAGFLDPADYPGFNFTEISPSEVVSASQLSIFDTMILWQFCDVGDHAGFTTALVDWVRAGGKLLVWDGDTCSGADAADYSWLGALDAAFDLSTAGRNGIRDGSLAIFEENELSSANVASSFFVDVADLVDSTDAVGDANVMTAHGAVWCVDMEAQNARCDAAPGVSGPVHAYTKPGELSGSAAGWLVYSGLDYDGAGSGLPGAGRDALVSLLRFELEHDWGPPGAANDDLLCGTGTLVLSLVPLDAVNQVGLQDTVTATLTAGGAPLENITVQFEVFFGPHVGTNGTDVTNASGKAMFPYTGFFTGVDSIRARVPVQPGIDTEVVSAPVAMTWTASPFALELTPGSAINPIGAEHTVTAKFTENGAPQQGIDVDFEVFFGPHASTGGMGVTDANGETIFTYTGTTIGIDSIGAQAPVQAGIPVAVVATPVSKTWIEPGMTLIGMNDVAQFQGVDELVVISDPSTGVATLVGSLGANFLTVEAIAVQPSTQRVFAVDDNRLLEVDPLDGSGTLIGPTGFSDIDGIAFQPGTEVLYGVTNASHDLLTIDTSTGAGTLVNDQILGHRKRLEDIAFHPDGRAYVLRSDPALFWIDITTGAELQRWDLTGASSMEALVWSLDGTTLYSTADRGSGKDLVTIDLNSSTVDFVHPTLSSGFKDIEALAWLSSGVVSLMSWDTTTDVPEAPVGWLLGQNRPNPFNPSTSIDVAVSSPGRVALEVYDVSGRLVRVLHRGPLRPGSHRFVWDGRSDRGNRTASGVYFCQLRAPGVQRSIHMIMTK
ncbi:MAG: FlgD immunoglobulin-like domain containing protein [Candidatus Krumholzibacteriia bacterium]